MKKVFQSALFRALCAIITGGLLVIYNQNTLQWLTILVGVIFFVSGIISVIAYFALKSSANKILEEAKANIVTDATATDNISNVSVLKPSITMPIVGVASMVLGVMLAVLPDNFHEWFIYILAALLIIGSLGQMFTLVTARRYASIGWGFWVMPIVILISGIVVIVYHVSFQSTELIIGLAMLIYGITEIFNAIALHRLRSRFNKRMAAQQAQETADANDVPTAIETKENA